MWYIQRIPEVGIRLAKWDVFPIIYLKEGNPLRYGRKNPLPCVLVIQVEAWNRVILTWKHEQDTVGMVIMASTRPKEHEIRSTLQSTSRYPGTVLVQGVRQQVLPLQ